MGSAVYSHRIQARPGDIGIMSQRGTDTSLIGQGFNGHTFYVTNDAGDTVGTVEGNSNPGGSRNGYMVVRRTRSKKSMLALIRMPE